MRLTTFLARELAPSHRRIVEAARTAIKATVTAGLAATMQISGPFGPLFAFRIGQPGISLGLFEAAVIIICAAAMQAAIVPIAGKLLDDPGLILAFLFAVFAAIAYLLSNTRLFLPLALVAIGTITTVYVGIFEPAQIGWGSAYTFDGILVATLVMVAIDTLIWPSPPEPRLLESIAADLTRTRRRLELVGRRYLDPFSAPLLTPEAKSRLAPGLTLLKSVEERMKLTPERLAALLDALMTSERLYLEVEHLAVLAGEALSDELRQNHAEELESALRMLDAALAEQIDDILAGLRDVEKTNQLTSHLFATIRHLSESTAHILAANQSITPQTLNFLAFVRGLEVIAKLLQPRQLPLDDAAASTTEPDDELEASPFFDPARLRFSIKLGTTITLGLLVGLTTQRADLQTILWSIAVAGQPNQFGAVIRKTILRIAGCIMGGVAALAAMLIVSENFDSLPPYLVAIFGLTMFATYVSQSSEWLGYAGIQTGITFLICYVGLAPSSDIYRPLWRFWGIVLGVLTTGFVFLFLWREYAGDKVMASLAKLTRTILAFAKDVAEKNITKRRIEAVERHVSTNLLELLNMADQARLEGRHHGSADAETAVEAATVLIRIAFSFQAISRLRADGTELALPHDVNERCAALEQEYCSALESDLRWLESGGSIERSPTPAPTEPMIELARMNKRVTSRPAEGTDVSVYVRDNLLPQIESYRRLSILLGRLHTELSKLAFH